MFEVLGLGAEFVFSASGTERIIDIANDLNTLSATLSSTGGSMDMFNATAESFSNALMNQGVTEFSKGVAELSATMLLGVSRAAAWQDQMIDATRYMSDTSIEAQNKYNNAIATTAKQLGQTKEAINAATISYMMMGKDTDTALRLAENAGYASVVWDMAASDIANSFRQIKSAFKIDMENQDTYEHYLNMINEVGNNTAATSADVVKFVGDYGGSLATVGKSSIEETMAMAAAARYANISVDEFGTTVQRLANTYANGKSSYFEELGVQVTDANGELISFAEALHLLGKEWDTLGASQKQNFLSGFGGLHAANLGLYMGSMAEYEKALGMTQNVPEDSASQEFSRVTDTFNFALSQMRTTLSDFGQALWGTLLPPLTKIIKMANSVVESISSWMQAHPTIMKLVAGFIALQGLVFVVGGAFKILSAFAIKFLLSVQKGIGPLSGFTSTLSGVGTVLKNLAPTMKTSITQMIKMGSTLGILYAAWKFDLFGMRTHFEDFVAKMKISLSTVKDLLSADMTAQGLVNGLNDLHNSNSIIDHLAEKLVRLGLVWKGVAEGWNSHQLSDDMFQKLQDTGLLPLVTNILLFKMRMDYFFQGLKEGFLETRDQINEWAYTHFGPALAWIKDNIIIPLIDTFPALEQGFNAFFDIINGAEGEQANQRFKELGKSVGGMIAIFLTISTVTKVIGVLGKVGTAIKTLGNLAKIVVTPIKWVAKGLWDLVKMSGLGTFASNIKFAFDAVRGGAATAGEAIEFLFPKLTAVVKGVGGFGSSVGSFVSGALGSAGTVAETIAPTGEVIGTQIVGGSGILGGLSSVGTALGSGAATAGGAAAVGAGSIAGGVGGIIGLGKGGYDLYQGISKGDDSKKWQGGTELGMVGAGAAAGAGIGALVGGVGAIPGALIGAGVGGIGAVFGGEGIGGALQTFFTETAPQAIDTFTNNILPTWIETLRVVFTETIPQFFSDLYNSVVNFFTVTIPAEFDKFSTKVGETVDAVGQWFSELPYKIGYALGEALGSIALFAIDAYNNFTQFCTDTYNSVVNFFTVTIPSVFDSFVAFMGGVIDGIGIFFTVDVPNFFISVYNSVVNFFTVTIPTEFNNFITFMSGIIDSIGNFFTVEIPAFFTRMYESVVQFFTVDIPNKFNEFVSYIGDVLIPNITSFFESLPEKFYQFAVDTVQGFINGIGGMIKDVSNAIGDFGQGVIDGFKDKLGIHSPSRVLAEMGMYSGQGYILGLQNTQKDAIASVSEFSDGVVNAFDGNLNGTANITPNMQPLSMAEYQSNLPITTDLNNTNTFYSELSENGVMGQIINQLVMINATLARISSITNSDYQVGGKINTDYIATSKENISTIQNGMAMEKANQMNIVIEGGAIQNHFNVNSDNARDAESLVELITSVLDENLLPLLMEKIRDIKSIMNE